MSDYDSRFWEIFFEVYESLPRQGPGNRDCTERALRLCDRASPCILGLPTWAVESAGKHCISPT
jgi:hypothetical protein